MTTALATAAEAAEWFLNYVRTLNCDQDEEFLSNQKLQKLLYYAQGASLVLLGQPLFEEPILRWHHGPVVKSVYETYAPWKGMPIPFEESCQSDLDPAVQDLLKAVYASFGQYSAWGLRNLIFREEAFLNAKLNEEISKEAIEKTFRDQYVQED